VAADAVALEDIGDVELVADGVRRRAAVTLDPSVVEASVKNAGELIAEASAGDPASVSSRWSRSPSPSARRQISARWRPRSAT
jgi:hypothetical protein